MRREEKHPERLPMGVQRAVDQSRFERGRVRRRREVRQEDNGRFFAFAQLRVPHAELQVGLHGVVPQRGLVVGAEAAHVHVREGGTDRERLQGAERCTVTEDGSGPPYIARSATLTVSETMHAFSVPQDQGAAELGAARMQVERRQRAVDAHVCRANTGQPLAPDVGYLQ